MLESHHLRPSKGSGEELCETGCDCMLEVRLFPIRHIPKRLRRIGTRVENRHFCKANVASDRC